MKAKKKKIIVMHLFFAIVLIWMAFFWKCPSKVLFGIPCPGCGLTRAHKAALQLNFKEAFSYHPLFPVAIPTLLYLIHYRVLPWRLPRWAEWVLGILIAVSFFGLYGYRMIVDPVFRADGGTSLFSLIINGKGKYL